MNVHIKLVKFHVFLSLLSPSSRLKQRFSPSQNGAFPKQPPEYVNLKAAAWCFRVYGVFTKKWRRLLSDGQGCKVKKKAII